MRLLLRTRDLAVLFVPIVLVLVTANAPALAASSAPGTDAASEPAESDADSAKNAEPANAAKGPRGTKGTSVDEMPIPWRVWRLFDPKLSPRELGWSIGPGYLRTFDREDLQYGVVLARAETMEERRGPVFLSLEREWGLRFYERWTIVPVHRYLYQAGFRVGPLELGGGVSLIPFTIDFSEGRFSFSGPSPGAVARVGFRSGRLRVSVRVEREYLWRWGGQPNAVLPPTGKSLLEALRVWNWTGQPDALMTGVVLEIAGEQVPDYRSGGHPLVFIK